MSTFVHTQRTSCLWCFDSLRLICFLFLPFFILHFINFLLIIMLSFDNIDSIFCFTDWKWGKRVDLPPYYYWATQTISTSNFSGGKTFFFKCECAILIISLLCWLILFISNNRTPLFEDNSHFLFWINFKCVDVLLLYEIWDWYFEVLN